MNGASGAQPDAAAGGSATGAPDAGAVATLVAPASCELGAHCRVTVSVACPAGVQCEFTAPGRLGPFEVLAVEQPGPAAPAGRLREWHLTIVAFDPGDVDLPPVELRMVDETDGSARLATTAPARVTVSLVDAADDAALRPDQAPMDPGPDWRVVAAWTAGVLVALAVAGLAWRWWRRRPRRAAPPPVLTAEAAIGAIRALTEPPATSPAQVLERYASLSRVLRDYLGLPLEVRAEALTSTELAQAIDGARRRARPWGGPPATGGEGRARAAERTRSLLSHIDTVKYGGLRPEDRARAEDGRLAIALVEEVQQWRASATEARRGVA